MCYYVLVGMGEGRLPGLPQSNGKRSATVPKLTSITKLLDQACRPTDPRRQLGDQLGDLARPGWPDWASWGSIWRPRRPPGRPRRPSGRPIWFPWSSRWPVRRSNRRIGAADDRCGASANPLCSRFSSSFCFGRFNFLACAGSIWCRVARSAFRLSARFGCPTIWLPTTAPSTRLAK